MLTEEFSCVRIIKFASQDRTILPKSFCYVANLYIVYMFEGTRVDTQGLANDFIIEIYINTEIIKINLFRKMKKDVDKRIKMW